MAKKLYVGNLPYSIDENGLKDLFSEAGTVSSAIVIKDRETQRSRGFGFVEMDSDEEAQKAVDTFNEKEVEGRKLIVNEARPQRR